MRWRISTPFAGLRAKPATVAEPELGAIRVPSMRTVVVLPAPFGPRNPNTSPLATRSDKLSTAVRSPKRFVRFSISRAGELPADIPLLRQLCSLPSALRPFSASPISK